MEKEVLKKLIWNLKDTPLSMEEVAKEMGFNIEDLNVEDLAYINESICLCDNCGWWCESPSEDGLCFECWEEEELYYQQQVDYEDDEDY